MRHGKQTGVIQDVQMEEYTKDGEKRVVVKVRVTPEDATEDENVIANIYLTPKAAGMARRALKLCGFDVTTQSLQALLDDPYLLQTNKVPVDIFQDGDFGMKCEIVLASPPKEVASLDKMLREVKKKVDAPTAPPPGGDDIPF